MVRAPDDRGQNQSPKIVGVLIVFQSDWPYFEVEFVVNIHECREWVTRKAVGTCAPTVRRVKWFGEERLLHRGKSSITPSRAGSTSWIPQTPLAVLARRFDIVDRHLSDGRTCLFAWILRDSELTSCAPSPEGGLEGSIDD